MEKTLAAASRDPPTTLSRRPCAELSQWKRFRGNSSRRGGTSGLLLVAAIFLLSGVPGRDRSDGTVKAQESLSPRRRGGSAARRRRRPSCPAVGVCSSFAALGPAPPTESDGGGRAQGPGSGKREAPGPSPTQTPEARARGTCSRPCGPGPVSGPGRRSWAGPRVLAPACWGAGAGCRGRRGGGFGGVGSALRDTGCAAGSRGDWRAGVWYLRSEGAGGS